MASNQHDIISDLNLEEILLAMADSEPKYKNQSTPSASTNSIRSRPLPTPGQAKRYSEIPTTPNLQQFAETNRQNQRHSFHSSQVPNHSQMNYQPPVQQPPPPPQHQQYPPHMSPYAYPPQSPYYYPAHDPYAQQAADYGYEAYYPMPGTEIAQYDPGYGYASPYAYDPYSAVYSNEDPSSYASSAADPQYDYYYEYPAGYEDYPPADPNYQDPYYYNGYYDPSYYQSPYNYQTPQELPSTRPLPRLPHKRTPSTVPEQLPEQHNAPVPDITPSPVAAPQPKPPVAVTLPPVVAPSAVETNLSLGTPTIEKSHHLGLVPPKQPSPPTTVEDTLPEVMENLQLESQQQAQSQVPPVVTTPPVATPPPTTQKVAAKPPSTNSTQNAPPPSTQQPTREPTSKKISDGLQKLTGPLLKQVSTKSPAPQHIKKPAERKKIQPQKPQNAVQLVALSRPITDPDADGFDFDESDFEQIDRYVKDSKIPVSGTSRDIVINHLTKPYRHDWQKIRAIFTWIIYTIRYDYTPNNGLNSPNQRRSNDTEGGDDDLQSEDSEAESDSQEMEDPTYSETAESVLSRGSARRFGFASLFHEMAKHVGIESILIKGYLKDPSKPRENTKLPEPNHAWIAVKIQGYYRIIDCGLGCSSHPLNPNGTSEPFYFLTNPQKIIFTHFPIEHRHQLIRPPVSFAVFNELPYATSHYFDYGIRFLNLKGGIFTVNDDQTAELDILVPHGAQTSAQLEIPDPNGRVIRKQKPLVQHKMDGNRRISKLLVRIKGKESMGVLKFFCNMSSLESTPSNSPLVLSMTVQHTGIKQPEDFVHIIPSSKEFYIVEPINLNLLYNISYRFHVQPSGDNKHFKLVLRSPNLKTHKFVYYPGDQGYVANVTVRERGQWAISYMKDMGNDGRPTKKDSWINVACYKCI